MCVEGDDFIKALCGLTILAVMLSLCACSKAVQGQEGLLQKAREEIPLADIENMELVMAGATDVDGYSLVWFISGNEYQKHSYFPMEFKIVEDQQDQFEFVRAYKAYDCGQDIAAYPWNGYVFLVNNANCKKLALRYEDGSKEEIQVPENLPFLYATQAVPVSYTFLDENGNEIM